MEKIRFFLSHFQLQYRRTPALHKVAVAAAIVLSSITLICLRLAHWETEAKLSELRHQVSVMEQQNEELRQDIDGLGTTDSIRQIAQEELGLVDPDTIIYEQAD